jgi:hypothetical protein
VDLIVIKNGIADPNLEAKGDKANNNTGNKAGKADDQLTFYKLGILFFFIQWLCLTIIR